MSPDLHGDPGDGIEEVSRAYRAVEFRDAPPAELDRAVLAAARQAHQRRRGRYLPSLAMAATVLLALGIVLRLTMPDRTPIGPVPDQPRPAVSPPGPAAERAPTPAERPAAQAQDQALPAAAPATTQENATLPAAREAVEAPAAGQAAVAQPAARALANTVCSTSRLGEAGPWLDCIRALAAEGQLGSARAELDEFIRAHPDFALPEDLEAALTP